jgi:hypothetical protein
MDKVQKYNSFDLVLGYGLGDQWFKSWKGLGIFFTFVALGPTQPPSQWLQGALSLELKRPGREADQSPPSSAEEKNARIYTSTPQYTLMVWCSTEAQG